MRKPPSKPRRPRAKTSTADAAEANRAPVPPPEAQVRTARPQTEQELAGIVRATEGQPSAEGFWKAAGRLAKLR